MCHAKSNSWHTWQTLFSPSKSYTCASVVDHKRITGRDACADNEAMLATTVAEAL